jgi:hypothetical protein
MPSSAADVEFEGSYRARGRVIDTLSLDRSLANSEGLSAYLEHRLWLRPRFIVSDDVSLIADFKGLDNVPWGVQPIDADSPVPNAPPTFEQGLTAPTSDTDPTSPLSDFTLWRVWGDVHTPIGRFRFGRMPLHWGRGLWMNDGLTTNPFYTDYGDTADRLQWEYLVQDQFFIQLSGDVNAEGFLNAVDDTTAFNTVLAYRSEQVVAGINTQLAHTVDKFDDTSDTKFNLFTIDLALDATMGKLSISTEGIGQFGGGSLSNGFNNVNVTAFGAALEGKLDLSSWTIVAEAGMASGDGNDADAKLKTFTFDRDYSVGLMLFELPLPTLGAAAATADNGNRSNEVTLTGNAVSNALYLRPSITRSLIDGLDLEASVLAARTAKLPDRFEGRQSYGMEFGLGIEYSAIEHFEAGLQFGTLLPGSYFRDYADDLYEDFDDPAFGLQLTTRVHF